MWLPLQLEHIDFKIWKIWQILELSSTRTVKALLIEGWETVKTKALGLDWRVHPWVCPYYSATLGTAFLSLVKQRQNIYWAALVWGSGSMHANHLNPRDVLSTWKRNLKKEAVLILSRGLPATRNLALFQLYFLPRKKIGRVSTYVS